MGDLGTLASTMDSERPLLFVSDFPADYNYPLMEAVSRRHGCSRQSTRDFAEICFDSAHEPTGVVIDTDLTDLRSVANLRRGITRLDRNGTFVVVIADPYGSVDLKFAMAIAADRVIPRIIVDESAAFKSLRLEAVIEVARADFVRNGLDAIDWLILKYSQPQTLTAALSAGETALDRVFSLAKTGTSIDSGTLVEQNRLLVRGIDEHGLQRWLATVREHHSATYRHSLAVTGLATAFGRSLKFSSSDVERLTLSALLHDVGKAKVPVEILEKRTELTRGEDIILRQHPANGRAMVEQQPGIEDHVLDVISQHHELLDGSGYPYGLSGRQIGDMTRLMTICDRFSNLISRHTAHGGVSTARAFDTLRAMGPKLDMPLVIAFKSVVANLELQV